MVYNTTNWEEHSMSEAEKISALNNLENMYTEIVNYINAMTHSNDYYTKDVINGKHFQASNDGSGSGLICKTLDGYTANQILESSAPVGCIAIWSGSYATIPAGWALCDGTSGTPDLRDLFIVAAGGNYSQEATGGSSTINFYGTVYIKDHILTLSELPKHTHASITDHYRVSISNKTSHGFGDILMVGITNNVRPTTSKGLNQGHTHTASFSSDEMDKVVPYYYACYIIKT